MCDDEVTRCFKSYRSAVFLVPCPSPPITSSDCRTSKDISSSAQGSSPSSSSSIWQLCSAAETEGQSERVDLHRARGSRVPPRALRTHLCHNVGISHIEVVRVELTAVGRGNGEQGVGGACCPSPTRRVLCVSSSNLFSVRAVRLKCKISWCSGSGLLSLSSSSSPSSCSIAFCNDTREESLNGWARPGLGVCGMATPPLCRICTVDTTYDAT